MPALCPLPQAQKPANTQFAAPIGGEKSQIAHLFCIERRRTCAKTHVYRRGRRIGCLANALTLGRAVGRQRAPLNLSRLSRSRAKHAKYRASNALNEACPANALYGLRKAGRGLPAAAPVCSFATASPAIQPRTSPRGTPGREPRVQAPCAPARWRECRLSCPYRRSRCLERRDH